MSKLKQNEIEKAVCVGEKMNLPTVDFSDPNRPKTCLEVDFPILPINSISAIEGNAGKPIYQMSKWWARRRSSVFRATLLAAAIKAPENSTEAAKTVWNAYYGNHQENKNFNKLKVADIFMGGGTTIVEGLRLGFQMFGNDLNPVAHFIVKNETANVDKNEVEALLKEIETKVKPEIQPFYNCNCPRHSNNKNKNKNDIGNSRAEIIYTFWGKHAKCQNPNCGHYTPIISSPAFALKELTVKCYPKQNCPYCQKTFDLETQEMHIAPDAIHTIAEDETPFATLDAKTYTATCPHCNEKISFGKLEKSVNKKINFTLLVHPDYLRGIEASDTINLLRQNYVHPLIEHRGKLPKILKFIDNRNSARSFQLDTSKGTVPKNAHFLCAKCGQQQSLLDAVKKMGKPAPFVPYAIQAYCKECNEKKQPYGGRFFATPNVETYNNAVKKWKTLIENSDKNSLNKYYPKQEIPTGYNTDQPRNHLYFHWYQMFNPRQLLGLTTLLKTIDKSKAKQNVKEFVLGTFMNFIRNQCMFSFWHIKADKIAPALSNLNFHPKSNTIETSFFSHFGYGPWTSTIEILPKVLDWQNNPWELLTTDIISEKSSELALGISGKSVKVYTGDSLAHAFELGVQCELSCTSSSELSRLDDLSFDLIITDPPFGGLVNYSELSDFFYVWLKIVLQDCYPELFGGELVPKTLEAVANSTRHGNAKQADEFYQNILTECWKESNRILKSGGILAFTFHHSEDKAWVNVLRSLFESGFYLEQCYPIRSDEKKGEGQFGSKEIEFDIIHVCRKRAGDDANVISWASLRKFIIEDVKQVTKLLTIHCAAGLPDADIAVIKRGKALEHYSRHYGKVRSVDGKDVSIEEVLFEINRIIDDFDAAGNISPNCEFHTRLFLQMFNKTNVLPADQLQKFLRSTGISDRDFTDRNWCSLISKSKIYVLTEPLKFLKNWQSRNRDKIPQNDFEQALYLIGVCTAGSKINAKTILNPASFVPHRATIDVIEWFVKNASETPVKDAANVALKLFREFLSSLPTKQEEKLLF
ncbi:MAG: DUF1156 domain-containing protein [Planctomycetaceae bacterium]|jgi:adenine-specific DNA methylase|nr:DUF1156 domain-containing protein [Planctomycetaceae bacterium]